MVNKENEQFGLGQLPEDAITELHPTWQTTSFTTLLTELNKLVEMGLITDYAIGGGYASVYHHIPYSTYDVDVLLILGSDEDFHRLYEHFERQGNMISKVYIFIANLAVQFFPNISPLFDEAVKEAKQIEIDGVPSRVVNLEYLIALLLKSFRLKDRIKITELIGHANMSVLYQILGRFDDEERQLSKRLEELLGKS